MTPTEAAGLGAAGALGLAYLKRKLNRTTFKTSIAETLKASAMIFLLLGGASIFTTFLSTTGVISSATTSLISMKLSPRMILIAIFILYIVLGMFLDPISMMILTLPIVLPVLKAEKLSIIWFGVVMCMLAEIGCITPPMGLNVYVMKGALGKSVDLNDIFAGALPFVLLMILIIIILYIYPEIALWLPSMIIQ